MAPQNMQPLKVRFVAPIWATYRAALVEQLQQSPNIYPSFHGSAKGHPASGVAQMDLAEMRDFHDAPLVRLPGGAFWQRNWIWSTLRSDADLVIATGDPHYLSTVVATPLLRLRGKSVLLWTHGWTRPDKGLKRQVRLLFYRLANGLLLYSDEGKDFAVQMGLRPSRLHVINNSMGYMPDLAERDRRKSTRQRWIVISRLIPERRIEQVIRQVHRLELSGRGVDLTIVGDGPCRAELERLSSALDASVSFEGAIYDASTTNNLLQSSDVLVSPGHVGLAAVHALSNGCPVSTHKNPSAQMPEHVVVVQGVTGVRWPENDYDAMGDQTYDFVCKADPAETAQVCREVISEGWTPQEQAGRMLKACADVHGRWRSRFRRRPGSSRRSTEMVAVRQLWGGQLGW